jgi:hypothetical protein
VSTDNVTINNITASASTVRARSVLRTRVTRALLQVLHVTHLPLAPFVRSSKRLELRRGALVQ